MAKRSKNKKKTISPKNLEYTREIRHLETMLKYSLRAIDGKSEELDNLFTNQADKIQDRLNRLKESR